MLRDHSWESMGDNMGCCGLNQGQLCERPTSCAIVLALQMGTFTFQPLRDILPSEKGYYYPQLILSHKYHPVDPTFIRIGQFNLNYVSVFSITIVSGLFIPLWHFISSKTQIFLQRYLAICTLKYNKNIMLRF